MKTAMDLNLLRIFILIMRTRSISQSAEILGISTPAASQALNRLRNHYNDRLFIRQGRSMQPTLLAENIYDTVREAYDILSDHSQAYQAFEPQTSSRTFRIACHQDTSSFIAGPLFKMLSEIAPHLTIEFKTHHKNDQQREQDLKYKKVDFILTTSELPENQYQNCLLYQDYLYATYKPDHPRLSGVITEEQFFNEQHIIWRPQSSNVETLDLLTPHPLPDRKSVMQVDSIYHALLMCTETEMVCCAPLLSIHKLLLLSPSLAISPLPFKTLPLSFYLSQHKAHTADQGAMWLKNLIQELFNNLNTKLEERIKTLPALTDREEVICDLSAN